ncbi:hypothetical protein [Emticicia sp. C21]|uniref:hypothetical protein n=1 Tax=Emticicia sp. C21 TaxID=2302915 RepID=UPI000E34FDC4|nr:hypothetical protein [Emticicia sp. C21]RFS16783.1 hypothetical protein D0T08_08875 [Emticicia sp. C21]
MIKNIISLALLLISVFLSFKHGWDTFTIKDNPESAKMMADLGIPQTIVPFLGIFMFVVGLLVLFPKTFFIGNLLNAMSIVAIMALALRAGNITMTLMEIPFLIMPLLMIWLKYPFKN